VQDSLKAITKLVLLHLTRKYEAKKPAEAPARESRAAVGITAPAATPAPIPVAAGAHAASLGHAPAPVAARAAATDVALGSSDFAGASFGGDEVDDLVDEVKASPIAPEPMLPTGPAPSIRVDVSTDAIDDVRPGLAARSTEEVDLFDDPGLEVAHLVAGMAQDIVIPVQIGEGGAQKRYKLSLRLQLHRAD
jgi:hypothetical protein